MRYERIPGLAGLLLSALVLTGCPQKSQVKPQAAAKPSAPVEVEAPEPAAQAVAAKPLAAAIQAQPLASAGGAGAPVSTAESQRYPTEKRNFDYGPARPWPRLVVPASLMAGPLAQAPLPGRPAALPTAVEASPAGPCAGELAALSLDLGPKEAWLSKKLKSAAIGALGRSLFGFGAASAPEPDRPPTVDDPLPKSARQRFHDRLSDTELDIAGRLDRDGLLLSTYIDDAPDKSTFHAIYLERKDCRRTFPDRYLNYRLWLEWSLSVSWTKTTRHYENDQLVSEQSKSGGFFKSGELDLAEGSIRFGDSQALDQYQQGLLGDLPPPIWQQMGFSSPESGVRGLGSQFDRVDTESILNGDTIAVVHVTRVVDGRYVTRALPFRLEPGVDGSISFSRL